LRKYVPSLVLIQSGAAKTKTKWTEQNIPSGGYKM
jgi:hypothetical protein